MRREARSIVLRLLFGMGLRRSTVTLVLHYAGASSRRLRFEDRRQYHFHATRRGHELDAEEFVVADANGPGLLRHRTDGGGGSAI